MAYGIRRFKICQLTLIMCSLAAILISLPLAGPAMAVELFRYRGAARDGGILEYIFETDEQKVPRTVRQEKAAEIAADFMTTEDRQAPYSAQSQSVAISIQSSVASVLRRDVQSDR